MNPLTSIWGTIISGFRTGNLSSCWAWAHRVSNLWAMEVWAHVLVGITWIGLLYYFNFVQVPAVGEALGDKDGPGPAAINKYVAPRALLWFRWAAVATWLTGAAALETHARHRSLSTRFTLRRKRCRSSASAPGWAPSCCSTSGC